MGIDEVTDIRIYKSTNYDKFKYVVGQREITKNNALEKVITENNLLDCCPMIVNENFEVIDGQHRLEVAKKHGLPIYYIIKINASSRTAQNMNIANKIWRLQDHMKHFSDLGNENYILTSKIIEKYDIPITVFINSFVARGSYDNRLVNFREGKAQLKYSADEIINICNRYLDYKNKAKKLFNLKKFDRNAYAVIFETIVHPKYFHERMMHAIDLYPDRFKACFAWRTVDNIREALWNGLYNLKISSHKHLLKNNKVIE